MPSDPFLNDALNLISNTTLSGIFWGVNISLYFLCAQISYLQYKKAPDERKKLVLQCICNSMMVLMVSLELSGDTKLEQLGYIDHGGPHGDAEEFIDSLSEVSEVNLISTLPTFVVLMINSIAQLWRIWVIWRVSSYKLVFIVLLLLLVIAAGASNAFGSFLTENFTPERIRLYYILGTIQAAAALTFTLLVTLLLVGRIIVLQRRFDRVMGTSSENSNQYTSIIAMLVESYALDSIWQTATMITFALSLAGKPDEIYDIFNRTGDQVTVFAFLLVSYRVLSKRAWTLETGRQLSSLRWNHDDLETARTTGQMSSLVDDSPPITTRPRTTVAGENGLLA